MTDHPTTAQSLVRALIAPLRVPQRVVDNIETIASVLLSLERGTHERLASIDERVDSLLAPLNRLDRRVAELQKLERAVTEQTDAIRHDFNTRLLAVEEEVHAMRAPIEGMSRDLATVLKLLPNPGDGPWTRLRDTLTSS